MIILANSIMMYLLTCVCFCCFFITSCPDLSLVFWDEIISKLACCLLFLNFHISNFFQYLKGYSFVDFISRGLQINFTVKINLFHLRFCIFISALFAFLPSTCCYFALRYVVVSWPKPLLSCPNYAAAISCLQETALFSGRELLIAPKRYLAEGLLVRNIAPFIANARCVQTAFANDCASWVLWSCFLSKVLFVIKIFIFIDIFI